MKKLSVLVALMLIITVGGVYATWTYIYATSNVDPVSQSITVELAQKASTTAAKGKIIVNNNDMGILVDDTDGNLEGDLVVTGSISGTFEPHKNAAADVQDGIPLYYTISVQNFPGLSATITEANLTDDDGDLTWTISAKDIRDALSLSLKLLKESDYNDFVRSLSNPTVTITINEGRASTLNEGPGPGGESGDPGDGGFGD